MGRAVRRGPLARLPSMSNTLTVGGQYDAGLDALVCREGEWDSPSLVVWLFWVCDDCDRWDGYAQVSWNDQYEGPSETCFPGRCVCAEQAADAQLRALLKTEREREEQEWIDSLAGGPSY